MMSLTLAAKAQRRWWRLAVVGAAAVVAATVGCADAPFERASAYDGQFSTPATFVGLPDTLFAVGDSVQLAIDAGERYAAVPRRWSVRLVDTGAACGGCGLVQVDAATGMLRATPTARRARWELRAQMGAQTYFDTIVTRQVPVRFRIICSFPCPGTDRHNVPILFSIYDTELIDANGVNLFPQADTAKLNGATLTIRNPTIVDVVDGRLRSRFQDGTTWIVRQQFGQADSILWTVRQSLALPQLGCPAAAAVGDTVQIGLALTDLGGSPMTTPVSLTWSLSKLGPSFDPRPISQDGSFVPTEPGDWQVRIQASHPTGYYSPVCVVQVS